MEQDIDTVGNLEEKLLSAIAATIMGLESGVKITGSGEKVSSLKDVLIATKQFYDELNRTGASLGSVMKMHKNKNRLAQEFEAKLGIDWPF